MPAKIVKQPGSRGGLSPEERLIYKREVSRRWRANNREKHRSYQKQYCRDNKEEVAVKKRAWAVANPEKVREAQKKSQKLNPAKYAANTRKYRRSHPEKAAFFSKTGRARRKEAPGYLYFEEWRHILLCFNGQCAKCGDDRKPTIDHIVPIDVGGHHAWYNVQPLCISCNSSKHVKTMDYRPLCPWFDRQLFDNGMVYSVPVPPQYI
jgi:5-methylcytosine-specific restriction endonuclease McrA